VATGKLPFTNDFDALFAAQQNMDLSIVIG
jgi:hypothetical protein